MSEPVSLPAMALNPLFTVTFDVSSGDNYGDFIAGIRSRVANPRHFSRNRPVLPPVEPPPPPRRWFHVVLRASPTAALTLATRADNLYLEGFRSSDGRWWELTPGILGAAPGGAAATYVGFGGSYRDLLGDTDRLTVVTLGPQQMAQAVNALAARRPADLANGAAQRRAMDAVAALLLMVHEATRFQTVSRLVAGLMHPKAASKSGAITTAMRKQVNGWQVLSAAMLGTDARPPARFAPLRDMGVDTVEEAAATVGILLFVEVPGGMTAARALQLFHHGN
ncbi:protein synthesis inhibitor II isoform X1 [Oryza sativa Japonica Group]|nr:protein synthesis inhibitor II isoform X1 [Oryza sativa Japonica Group]